VEEISLQGVLLCVYECRSGLVNLRKIIMPLDEENSGISVLSRIVAVPFAVFMSAEIFFFAV